MDEAKVLLTTACTVFGAMQIPFLWCVQAILHRGGTAAFTEQGEDLFEGYVFVMLYQWDIAVCLAIILVAVLQRLRSGWPLAIAGSALIYGVVSCCLLTARDSGGLIWWS
ncbi:MAG: hypothetical protein Aurels2KO_06030 [Aureliella sp.]